MGSISGWGTKILQTMQRGQNKQKNPEKQKNKKKVHPPSNQQILLQRSQGTTQEEKHRIQTSLENQYYQTPLMARLSLP